MKEETLKIECNGVGNWLNCIRCPYLCTKNCPLEDEEAFKRFSIYLIDKMGRDET